ncbi:MULTISPECIES: FAD-dependent oxidoreductase [Gammaproteobacteria]|uniref:FAD-dependent oxidoreductase n=1 Tax=Gammaproteobacteria TaxID=1236 RepID=UPI000DCF8699|nr:MULTISPECIES: FAD-dependent oxidoreductase [Gammaproteobacteria]RTE87762.1 glutamate synthase small subunit [Aliidiomarina sp. B3213]TCZ92456.1 glutamate synthase small subunit [Lysobacter sp. N42]
MNKNIYQFVDVSRAEPPKRSYSERAIEFVEIYHPQEQEQVAGQADRCIDCGNPYCEWKCPVHNYIPQWLELAAQGRVIEAAELSHQTNSLPEVCGRVCPQDRLCEGACTLNDSFGAVTIGAIEKYITDTALAQGWRPDVSHVEKLDFRVAVIGAGPAGLACADVLARQGISATVFDKHPEIGGLLTFGIPSFKLEKSVMTQRREIFESMGIEFKLNCEVGKDTSFEKLEAEYDAVFLALGTYKAIDGGLPGIETRGVYPALPYLIGNTAKVMNLTLPDYPYIDMVDKQVLVLGGGDTSMDCVRTAIRQQASKVTCAYRRDRVNMPGSQKELQNAEEEGVHFQFNAQPVEVLEQNGEVSGVRFVKTQLSEPDEHGRKRPEAVPNSEFVIEADAVILAFGYLANPPEWIDKAGIKLGKNSLVTATESSAFPMQTSNEKIFAGGDMVLGADLVVTAIAQGRKAADGIYAWLMRG